MGTVRSIEDVLDGLTGATARLIGNVGRLTDADVREPSLLPGWTRGHVLTHLARNAEGGTRLLGWARTGIPSYEYPSVAARAAAIEEGAGRSAAVLVADVRATAAALAEAAGQMPQGAWQNLVTWTTGQQTPAEMVARSRLAEVLIHHVDLDFGFGPGSWPATFVREMLAIVVQALNDRPLAPVTAGLHATDTGRSFQLSGGAADAGPISGTEAELLAWLLGRSDGADLARADPGPLPPVPSMYLT
jgi:maleylpyruvate isomerase